MSFVTAGGVSFCVSSARTIFLDERNDRYLCLAEDAAQSFRRLASGEALSASDHARLDELVSAGLLVPSREVLPITPCQANLPLRTVFGTTQRADTKGIVAAFMKIARAELAMRLRPLSSVLGRLRERKFSAEFDSHPPREKLEKVAAAFAACSLMSSALDKCLPRSVAAAHMMMDRSILPELVIGVRLQPFSAHCWVEHRGILINDPPDRVRNYTPILVV